MANVAYVPFTVDPGVGPTLDIVKPGFGLPTGALCLSGGTELADGADQPAPAASMSITLYDGIQQGTTVYGGTRDSANQTHIWHNNRLLHARWNASNFMRMDPGGFIEDGIRFSRNSAPPYSMQCGVLLVKGPNVAGYRNTNHAPGTHKITTNFRPDVVLCFAGLNSTGNASHGSQSFGAALRRNGSIAQAVTAIRADQNADPSVTRRVASDQHCGLLVREGPGTLRTVAVTAFLEDGFNILVENDNVSFTALAFQLEQAEADLQFGTLPQSGSLDLAPSYAGPTELLIASAVRAVWNETTNQEGSGGFVLGLAEPALSACYQVRAPHAETPTPGSITAVKDGHFLWNTEPNGTPGARARVTSFAGPTIGVAWDNYEPLPDQAFWWLAFGTEGTEQPPTVIGESRAPSASQAGSISHAERTNVSGSSVAPSASQAGDLTAIPLPANVNGYSVAPAARQFGSVTVNIDRTNVSGSSVAPAAGQLGALELVPLPRDLSGSSVAPAAGQVGWLSGDKPPLSSQVQAFQLR